MNKDLCFKVNTPFVIWEHIENDIIVINLENGYYYDISGLSASIWLMIQDGLSYYNIIDRIQNHFNKTKQAVLPEINFFLCTLEEEHLIVRVNELITPAIDAIAIPFDTYSAPVLKKYTDMENLLLIDPIHEVDEHGWPNLYPLPQE